MDFSDITAVIIAISSGLMGLFAWSHSSLSKRLDKLAIDLQDRKTDADIRILIQDKMQPFSLELKFLAQQIDHISRQYVDLDKKLDLIQSSLTVLTTNYKFTSKKDTLVV